jgi:site-specific recombinase/uncharacterized protein affecting Mg2+/Co2+ transport
MPNYQFKVDVEPQYLPDQSVPEQGLYSFAYTITVTNTGDIPAQLISRHWIIGNAQGQTEEVKGLGVVGHQPLLQPGESFQYTSGCRLRTATGTMRGSYFCVAEDASALRSPSPPLCWTRGRAVAGAALSARAAAGASLTRLLETLDPQAPLAQRHLWLIAVLDWVRGDRASPQAAASRVTLLLDAVQARPDVQLKLQQWWLALTGTVDASTLLADFGFAPRTAFMSELAARLRHKLLPGTPETNDASELFSLAVGGSFDAQWLAALDDVTLRRLAALFTAPSPVPGLTLWQRELLEAINFCAGQIRATGFAAELRQRMSAPARQTQPFHDLAADVEALRAAFVATPREPQEVEAAATRLRERLDACRQAANSVYAHLEEHGISVGLVFMLRQLRERVLRVRELMDCLLSATPLTATARLLSRLAGTSEERRSLRALFASNSSLLAAKLAERSAETGEHYITRTPAEYRSMLGKAAGGGAVTALTTTAKFALGALGLAAFWGGFWAGAMYSASFVLIQFLHWTLATKQPAMTAPAMAAKLKDLSRRDAVEDFVDEVTHLVRSQVAAVVGNVGMVTPCVLLISYAIYLASGHNMISHKEADYVFPFAEPAVTGHAVLRSLHRGAAVRLQPDRGLGGKLVRAAPAGFRGALQPAHHGGAGRGAGGPLGALHARAHLRLGLQHLAGLHAGPAAAGAGLCGPGAGGPARHAVHRPAGGGRRQLRAGRAAHARAVVVHGSHPADWCAQSHGQLLLRLPVGIARQQRERRGPPAHPQRHLGAAAPAPGELHPAAGLNPSVALRHGSHVLPKCIVTNTISAHFRLATALSGQRIRAFRAPSGALFLAAAETLLYGVHAGSCGA